jgi:BON domain
VFGAYRSLQINLRDVSLVQHTNNSIVTRNDRHSTPFGRDAGRRRAQGARVNSPYVYSAYLDPFTPYVATWYVLSAQPLGTDSDITNRIKDGFLWSPFVHSGDIHVSVVNGKATLTGTVRSYRERQAASDNALDAGAVVVDNELKVG